MCDGWLDSIGPKGARRATRTPSTQSVRRAPVAFPVLRAIHTTMPRIPTARNRAIIQSAILSLPIPTYMNLLHEVIARGRMPILDDNNCPTGKFDPVAVEERLAATKYIMNKVVPDARDPLVVSHEGDRSIDFSRLSDAELASLADAAIDAVTIPAIACTTGADGEVVPTVTRALSAPRRAERDNTGPVFPPHAPRTSARPAGDGAA